MRDIQGKIPREWANEKYSTFVEKISTTGKKVKQKEYENNGKFPVVDQGQVKIGGYINDKRKLIHNENQLIVFGDHTKVVKLIKGDFAPGADGVKVLKPKAPLNPFLLNYFTQAATYYIPSKGYARHFQFMEKFKFPLPPLPEQLEIVRRIEAMFSGLDHAIENLKKAREQLKTYRQAVLKHAFEGKLTQKWRKERKGAIHGASIYGASDNRASDHASSALEPCQINGNGVTLIL